MEQQYEDVTPEQQLCRDAEVQRVRKLNTEQVHRLMHLEAELDEAIEALRPMASCAEGLDFPGGYRYPDDTSPMKVTLGHCRQAAAIVARYEQGSKEGGK